MWNPTQEFRYNLPCWMHSDARPSVVAEIESYWRGLIYNTPFSEKAAVRSAIALLTESDLERARR